MKRFSLVMIGLLGLSFAAQAQVLVYRGTINGRLKGRNESQGVHHNAYLVRYPAGDQAAIISWWTTGSNRHHNLQKFQSTTWFANSGTTEQGLFRTPGSNEVQFAARNIPGNRTMDDGVFWWRDGITGGVRTGLGMLTGNQFLFRGTGFILGNQTQWSVNTAKVLRGNAIFRHKLTGGVKSGIWDMHFRLDGPSTRRVNGFKPQGSFNSLGDFFESVMLLEGRLINRGFQQ